MSLTRVQVRDYTKGKLTVLDQQRVQDGLMNIDVNLAQRKVQQDLMPLLGMKYFTKQAIYTGSVVVVPADILAEPNAIIDLKAGTGNIRASYTINYTSPAARIKHTALQPGIAGNSINISLDGAAFGSPGTGVLVTLYNGVFSIDFAGGQTCTQIAAALNADPVYSQYMTASTDTPSAVPVPGVGTAVPLAGGTGSGWYPAREITIEESNRLANDSFRSPRDTSPAYVRKGTPGAVQVIEIQPNTVTYAQLYYKYCVPDLNSDTDTLTIPPEFQELVLTDMLTKTYQTLKENNSSQEEAIYYETKVKELNDKYNLQLQQSLQEKTRLGSSDNSK